jgi:hypothetical protein
MGLNRYLFDFGAAPFGSPDSVVYVHVSNMGKLPVDVRLSFPYDTMVSVEKWAQNQVPRSKEEEKELEIIINNLFDIHPKSFHLEPDESTVVTFIYKHTIADTHSVPVLLQIPDGKSLVIDLTGQTLQPKQRFLHFRSFEHEFQNVDISRMDCAPIQYFQLRNSSEEPVAYAIDTEALERLKVDNYGFEILTLENPTGYIPEKNGTSTLRFIFRPLEAKSYEVELPISIFPDIPSESTSSHGYLVPPDEQDISYYITFRGKGVNRNQPAVNATSSEDTKQTESEEIVRYVPHDVPSVQKIVETVGQISAVSMEVCDLGDVPALSVNRRMVILRNLSSTDDISFEWDCTLPVDNNDLSMQVEAEPASGILKPKDKQIVKLTFKAGSIAQNLDCDICCRVISETKRIRKEKQRKLYEESLLKPRPTQDERDLDEETLGVGLFQSKNELQKRQSVLHKGTVAHTSRMKENIYSEVIVRTGMAQSRSSNGITRSQSASSRFKTLQPVATAGRNSSVSQVYESDGDEFGNKELHIFKHFVRVNAQILLLDDYKNMFEQTLWKKSYVPALSEHHYDFLVDDKRPITAMTPRLIKTPRPQTPPALHLMKSSDAEVGKSLFSGILSSLLQEVVSDNQISAAFQNFNEARTPYYSEFSIYTPRVESRLSSRPQSASSSLLKQLTDSDNQILEEEEEEQAPTTETLHLTNSSQELDGPLLDYEQQSQQSESDKIREYEQMMEQDEAQYHHHHEDMETNSTTSSVVSDEPLQIIVEPSDRSQILVRPDFQEAIEWIFDETAFNIISEALYGDFDILTGE